MKRAVSVSLGSSARNKCVVLDLNGQQVELERIGTDGDAERARRLFAELDGQVDALGVGGVDLYLRLGGREYPLRAALRLVRDVRRTPLVDGRGLKHTLERRVFELCADRLGGMPHFRQAFVPVAVDRLGLTEAVSEVSEQVIIGDLAVALGIPLPIRGLHRAGIASPGQPLSAEHVVLWQWWRRAIAALPPPVGKFRPAGRGFYVHVEISARRSGRQDGGYKHHHARQRRAAPHTWCGAADHDHTTL